MTRLFPWDKEARLDTIARAREVVQAIENTLNTTDEIIGNDRERLQREKEASITYIQALEEASASPQGKKDELGDKSKQRND